jgi:hypothetical protein
VIEFMNGPGAAIGRTVTGLLCELKRAVEGDRWWPTDEVIRIRAAHATLLLQLSRLDSPAQARLWNVIDSPELDDTFLGWLHLVLFGWGPSHEGRQELLTLACVRKVHGDKKEPRAFVFPLLVVGADYGNIGINLGSPEGRVLETLRDAVTSRYERGG